MFHWICTQCGGSKSAPISINTEIFQQSAMRRCDCPPALKHDGNLDKDGDAKVQYGASYPGEQGIYVIETAESSSVYLNPEQALSLLSWLQQEKLTLEKLAKDEQG